MDFIIAFTTIGVTSFFIGFAIGESNEKLQGDKDSDILAARSYIVDYDTKIQKAQEMISRCEIDRNNSQLPRYRACKASIYDSFGIKYNSKVEISNESKSSYLKLKTLSLTPLTTEK